MAGNIYDLSTMLEVLRVQKGAPSFFLPNWFKRTITFDTAEILFDKVFGDDRFIAPFVVPTASGLGAPLNGYDTVAFRPAYVKMQDEIDPTVPFERQAGEALAVGSMTPEQRYNAAMAEKVRQQNVKLDNLFEWMAARAIIDGKVTIAGERYPSTLVDFRRDASLTSVLTAGAKWDQVTGDPLANLKTMRKQANVLSGARITKHIFGGDAWDMFSARVDLKEMMNKNYGGQSTNMTLITDGYEGIEYMGTIEGLNGAGRIEAWVHTGKYREYTDGTEQFVMGQKDVVGISDLVGGVRCFGAIKDKKAGFRPLAKFPKQWENDEGSKDFVSLASAPLMVPKEPNATFKLTVAN